MGLLGGFFLTRSPDNPSPEVRWEELLRLSRAWRLEWNASELLDRLSREAVSLAGLDSGAIFLTEEGRLTLRSAWPREEGVAGDEKAGRRLEAAERVVASGRTLCAHRLGEGGGDAGFVLCLPLSASGGVLGALHLESKRPDRELTARDQEFLEMFALQAAAAVEHLLVYQSAITDPLTGLFSHRYFQEQVDQEVRRARRTGHPTALMLMDLDHFKELNDSCGHEAGNQLLVSASNVLRKCLRGSDVVARFGGDEFEVLLPETDLKQARQVAEKVRWRIARLPRPEGGPQVTAALGVAAYPQNALDGPDLFMRADQALYRAKEKGRNRTAQSDFAARPPEAPSSRRGRKRPSMRLKAISAEAPVGKPEEGVVRRSPPPKLILEGQTPEQIDGHPVVRRLGTGSSGEVLLVRQPELDREVALKRPHSSHLTREQSEAFRREAQVTAALAHPGVIPIHTMGRDADGRQYYTMKPVGGLLLGQVLEDRARGDAACLRKFSQRFLLEALARVAETVAYAHSRNVAHMDLSPWNIVLGEFGEVLVIDWGEGARASPAPGEARRTRRKPGRAGKPSAPVTDTALVPGSPRYLAPEQLPDSGRPVGPAVDVHSMGAMLYEIVTGKSPYLRATHRETLQALRDGRVVPPEQAVPEAGVDPVLSALCMDALAADPAGRPPAREFAERLGRHVRSEKAWEVVRFGTGERPVAAGEWSDLKGRWRLVDGEWISEDESEGILVWRPQVPGDFRFAAEAWSEGGSELALIGHGPPPKGDGFPFAPPPDDRKLYQGYYFEFGAENNTCTKLARDSHDVMIEPTLSVEPGRRYRIEIVYEDGWLNCFIDGRRVFAHRELFPLSGCHVGFYSFGRGSHFRPLEVYRQNWGLHLFMRMADDLYSHGFHEAAIERYLQVADLNPHRLEGEEARLKIGVCLASGERGEVARSMFRSVRGTALEPYALAEEAMLEFRGRPDDDPRRALAAFEDLFSRFPHSPARISILEAVQRVRRDPRGFFFSRTLEEGLTCAFRLAELGLGTCRPPLSSQVKNWVYAALFLLRLGRHGQAAALLAELREALPPTRRTHASVLSDVGDLLALAALACGRTDLTGEWPWTVSPWAPGRIPAALAFNTNAPLHVGAMTGQPLAEAEKHLSMKEKDPCSGTLIPFSLLLAAGRPDRAGGILEAAGGDGAPGLSVLAPMSFLATGSGIQALHERALGLLAQAPLGKEQASPQFDPARTAAICRARWALEIEGDVGRAAAELSGQLRPPRGFFSTDGLLLQALLSSLGRLESPARAEVEEWSELDLAGTDRDLARMFFGKREPRPGELWPHPAFRPELRLWLALWLEARGDRAGAKEVAFPARDPRYGLANSQPAIERLLARLG